MSKKKQEASPKQQAAAPQPQEPAEPRALDLRVAKATDVGRMRQHNEDYVTYYVPPDPQQRARKGAIYLVADGMGGHNAGEVASAGAAESVIGSYYSDTSRDIASSLVRAFRAANKQIYEQAQSNPAQAGMGTTLVAAVVLGRKVYVASVGDSRAYLVSQKGITQITEDHSWVEEQVRAGLLTREQARSHPQRNVVTRALGSKPSVEVDLFEGALEDGDLLVLCSDGLSGLVEDREISTIVQESAPEEAGQRLIALANERGGSDNISVVIVSTRPAPVPLPATMPTKVVRRAPWIPALVATAAALVLALGGLGGYYLHRAQPTPQQASPSALALITPLTPAPSESPSAEASGLASPSTAETGGAAIPPGSEVAPTATPDLSGSPMQPTSTLAATLTASPIPSRTPRPQSTPTRSPTSPSATPTPRYKYGNPPTLEEPPDDPETTRQGNVTFRWGFQGQLSPGEAFQVLFWQGDQAEHLGAAEPTTQREQVIDIDPVLETRYQTAGVYYWSVVVVDTRTERRISPEAIRRRFKWAGPRAPTPEKQRPTEGVATEPVQRPTATGHP